MKENYLSIITNFGCHYTCPYCIVKNNNLSIPTTTVEGLNRLRDYIEEYGINIISISGGGDPLHNYNLNKEYYNKLFNLVEDIPIELHTSYTTTSPYNKEFPIDKCRRVVYHIRDIKELKNISRRYKEIIRVVFVVSADFTKEKIKDIFKYVKSSKVIDELSFRQMVDSMYKTTHYCENYLKKYHKKKWHYILQDDYNLYYCENEVSFKYEDFKIKRGDEVK